MSFKYGQAFALIALTAVPILLSLLKVKRKTTIVPNLWLWERAVKSMRLNVPFKKLVKDIILFLQIFAIVFIVIALAHPEIKKDKKYKVVLIVDTSMSMGTEDYSNQSRLKRAKNIINRFISEYKDMEVSIVEDNIPSKILLMKEKDRVKIRDVINNLSVRLTRNNHVRAIEKALTIYKEEVPIFLISDFSGDLRGLSKYTGKVRFIPVTGKSENVGICSVRLYSVAQNRFNVSVMLRNYCKTYKLAVISLFEDKNFIMELKKNLKPGSRKSVVFPRIKLKGKILKVKLKVDDKLSLDNEHALPVNTIKNTGIVLVGESYFLENAMRAAGIKNIKKITRQEFGSLHQSYDIYVFAGTYTKSIEALFKKGNYLIFEPGKGTKYSEGKKYFSIEASYWNQGSEILRYTNFENIKFYEGVILKQQGDILVDSPTTPILIRDEDDRGKVIVASFLPENSNLAFSINFPVLISNIISYLSEGISVSTLNLKQFLKIMGNFSKNSVLIYNGYRRMNLFEIYNEFNTGVYELITENAKFTFRLQLYDELELDVLSKKVPESRMEITDSNTTIEDRGIKTSYWKYFVLLSTILLMLEWFFYAKGREVL